MGYLDNFHYQTVGKSAHKIVFLHGLMGFGANWRRITSRLEKTSEILTYDQRGHGKSMKPETGYRPEDYADDLLNIIDEFNWKKIDLVGHSMGGRNAINFASRFAHRVNKLVIEDIAPNGSEGDIDRYNKLLGRVPTPFPDKLTAKNFLLNDFGNPVLGNYFYANLVEKENGLVDWRFSKSAILASVSLVRLKDRWPEWEAIRCPILVIRGENSPDFSKDTFREMLKRNPNSQGTTISGAGHWVHFDKPEEFTEAVRDFLK